MVSAAIRTPDFLTNHTGKTPYLPSVPWVIECIVALEAEANVPLMTRVAVASANRSNVYVHDHASQIARTKGISYAAALDHVMDGRE